MNGPNDRLLAAALEAFRTRGYGGTTVEDIANILGMSAVTLAADVTSTEQLMVDLVAPFLNDLDAAVDGFPRHPSWPGEGRRMLASYLDVLLRYRDVVIWIDADQAVLQHPTLGKRLSDSNHRVRDAIRGDNRATAARLGASAVLGALWRPLRNLTDVDASSERSAMLDAAMAVVETVRGS